MIFALGGLVAGLLALLALPALKRRAQRLAERRLALTMPLSMEEVIAERDQIRAESAVAQRRIEQKAEALQDARAADMTELGRRAARIVSLESSLSRNKADAAALRADLARVTREREEAWGERAGLGKALYDADNRGDREHALRRDLEKRYAELHRLADERRGLIAAQQLRLDASEARVDSLEKDLQRAQDRRIELERDIAAAREADARTREDAAALRQAIAELSDRLLSLDAAAPAQPAGKDSPRAEAAAQ